jgi:dephospho-CoA kinase
MAEMKHPETPVRILLGGGIGSGKSIAGQRLEEFGATVVEADHLGHELLERDGAAFEAVSDRWPSVLVDGHIDRRALAEIVFADAQQLGELEALTHPAIVHRIEELASRSRDLVVEVPLILHVRGEWTRAFVDSDEEIRIRHAVERGGSEADVRRRIAAQPHRAEWMAWADETVENNGSIKELEAQIDALWHSLRDMA